MKKILIAPLFTMFVVSCGSINLSLQDSHASFFPSQNDSSLGSTISTSSGYSESSTSSNPLNSNNRKLSLNQGNLIIYLDEFHELYSSGINGSDSPQSQFRNITSIANLLPNEQIIEYKNFHFKTTLNRIFSTYHFFHQEKSEPLNINSFKSQNTFSELTQYLNFYEGEHATLFDYGLIVTNQNRIFQCTNSKNPQFNELTEFLNLSTGETINSITSGGSFNVGNLAFGLLTNYGRVFTWGDNLAGLLGNGTLEREAYPTQITNNFNLQNDQIVSINFSALHALAVSEKNHIFVWGDNQTQQLGLDSAERRYLYPIKNTSIQLDENEKILKITLGTGHSGILTNKSFFTWGWNYFGQIGNGVDRVYGSLFLSVQHTPTNIISNFNLEFNDRIIDTSFGEYSSSALSKNGKLFIWGKSNLSLSINQNNFLNTPQELNINDLKIASSTSYKSADLVEVGDFHNGFIDENHQVFLWGLNSKGQLGDGTFNNQFYPQNITNNFEFLESENPIDLFFGYGNSSLISSNSNVYVWGNNQFGQIGNNTLSNKNLPINITQFFNLNTEERVIKLSFTIETALALTNQGRIFIWGNVRNINFLSSLQTIYRTPQNITNYFNLENDRIISIESGEQHFILLTQNGVVYSIGSNNYGQLGQALVNLDGPNKPSENIPTMIDEKIIKISSGSYHSGALSSLGNLWVWGSNSHQQLLPYSSAEFTNGFSLNPISITNQVMPLNLNGLSASNLEASIINFDFNFNNSFIEIFYPDINFKYKLYSGNNSYRQLTPTLNGGNSRGPSQLAGIYDLDKGEVFTIVKFGETHGIGLTTFNRIVLFGSNNYGTLGTLNPNIPDQNILLH